MSHFSNVLRDLKPQNGTSITLQITPQKSQGRHVITLPPLLAIASPLACKTLASFASVGTINYYNIVGCVFQIQMG
jgi:hypothetical protein